MQDVYFLGRHRETILRLKETGVKIRETLNHN